MFSLPLMNRPFVSFGNALLSVAISALPLLFVFPLEDRLSAVSLFPLEIPSFSEVSIIHFSSDRLSLRKRLESFSLFGEVNTFLTEALMV